MKITWIAKESHLWFYMNVIKTIYSFWMKKNQLHLTMVQIILTWFADRQNKFWSCALDLILEVAFLLKVLYFLMRVQKVYEILVQKG